MKRYNIAAHARRGALKRGHSNFQPPSVKRATKERCADVKTAIVILASNRDGLHFPRQSVWHEWAKDCEDIGFAVYMEDRVRFKHECCVEQWSYWEPFLCPVQSSSAWGRYSLVLAELKALKWASERFRKASWFYVVSGDSIPTKSTASFVQGPLRGVSILGFADDAPPTTALNGWVLHEHSQWKVLSKVHVKVLMEHLLTSTYVLKEWKSCAMQQKRKFCCADVPDEWLIGTFLKSQGVIDEDLLQVGVCIMEQMFVSERSKCCKREITHAKLLTRSEFRQAYRQAWEDVDVFALRKVGPNECKRIRMS